MAASSRSAPFRSSTETLSSRLPSQRKNFTVNVNATEGGNVNGQTSISSSFNCGDNTPIVLTATADEGYHFVRWSNETQAPERDYRDVTNTIELLPTENMDITAEFALNTYKVSVVANPSSLGSVTPAVSEQIYTYDPQAGYPTLEISAKPNAGVDFNGWSNGVTTASQVVTIMSDTTFEASFSNIDYTISLAADPSNLGQVEASGRDGSLRRRGGYFRYSVPGCSLHCVERWCR